MRLPYNVESKQQHEDIMQEARILVRQRRSEISASELVGEWVSVRVVGLLGG